MRDEEVNEEKVTVGGSALIICSGAGASPEPSGEQNSSSESDDGG